MKYVLLMAVILCFALTILTAGCGAKGKADTAAEAPPPAQVEQEQDASIAKVDHPKQFPLAAASERRAAPELNATGVVSPDVSRNIPVISLASGRVVEIGARIGDTVAKGQLLMKVQSTDVAQAFSDYRQAVADEALARAQQERAQLLHDKGAIAGKDVEVAEDAETKAEVTVETAIEHLRVLGATDLDHPASTVNIYAPVSGVIIEQNVTGSAGVRTLDNQPNLFTIADFSEVWVVCDVYEDDLPFVRLGDTVDIHLHAYPNLALKSRVVNIGSILDPTIRTAKVRLEVHNPGQLRLGMFVSATFHGQNQERRAVVPATAMLHLHDRDWVYVPMDGGRFRRIEVVGGIMLPGNQQEIVSGIQPGQLVVTNALDLQNTADQ